MNGNTLQQGQRGYDDFKNTVYMCIYVCMHVLNEVINTRQVNRIIN